MKPGKVYIKRVAGKKHLQLAWIDPDTGRERRRSAKTNRQREAVRLADELERTLYRGVPVDGINWWDFCERYKSEHVATLKQRSRSDWPTVERAIIAIIDPKTIRCVTPSAISKFAKELRDQGKSHGTVTRYLKTLRVAMRWAQNLRLIHEAPFIPMPSRSKKKRKLMKGRPITLEEFERMLEKVPDVITNPAYVESWRHTLWVYWLSGIRLDEATELYWDRPDKLCIQGIDRRRPMLLIQQELEKGNEDRLYPLTPDFCKYLRKTPKEFRTGRVCRPLVRSRRKDSEGKHLSEVTSSCVTIGRTISRIGEKAGVVVTTHPKAGAKKYASAHDLRRSFGTRWAPLVQPPILQQLMRHKSLTTTMEYYVELRATETADRLWTAYETGTGDPTGDPERVPADCNA